MSRKTKQGKSFGLLLLLIGACIAFPPLGMAVVAVVLFVGIVILVLRSKPVSTTGRLGKYAFLLSVAAGMIWSENVFVSKIGPFFTLFGLGALVVDWLSRLLQTSEQDEADRDSRHIPRDVLGEVFRRDQGRCVECGSIEYLEVDHVIPWSRGGATSTDNLQLLCRGCNRSKAASV